MCVCRERAESGRESRGGGVSRRGRGVGRGSATLASEDGFDRFGKREFERHSGSDKTYCCLLVFCLLFSYGAFCVGVLSVFMQCQCPPE